MESNQRGDRGSDASLGSCRMSRSLSDIQREERKSRKGQESVKTHFGMSKPEESEEVEVPRCVWSGECGRLWSERRKGPACPRLQG